MNTDANRSALAVLAVMAVALLVGVGGLAPGHLSRVEHGHFVSAKVSGIVGWGDGGAVLQALRDQIRDFGAMLGK